MIETLPVRNKRSTGTRSKRPVPSMSLLIGESHLAIPDSARTLAGFREWAKSADYPERGRVSFLQNEIFIDMSPERANKHVSLKSRIAAALMQFADESELGIAHGDGVLVSNIAANISNVPDASFVLFTTLQSGRVQQVVEDDDGDYQELIGSPDLVVEVVSPSSVRKDLVKLREGYHVSGIMEYWIVNALRTPIEFSLLRWHESGYRPSPERLGWKYSIVLEREVQIQRVEKPPGSYSYRVALRKRKNIRS